MWSFLWRCVTLALLIGLMLSPAAAASDPFPSYPCIQANVAFWKKVYAEHPSSQGLIHDSRNLAIIYEVVTLASADSPQAAQSNELMLESVKEKYRRILTSLAMGRAPSTPEEKRVAGLFGPSSKGETLKAATENIRFQRCLSDRFQAGIVRSGRYLEQIRNIFSQYGLPNDLAYLPHVESSFDYQAYSKSGAVGIWQLMPDTGSRFLTITSSLDERRDPILATHAAAKYLQGNYKKLQSWPLALTAYNHGLTAMLRAKNSLGAYEKIYQGYDGPRFGFASRNFYAEFLAAREIAKNYRQHFQGLRLADPLQTKTVRVKNTTSARDLSGHFKVDLPVLAELNPALLKPVWEGRRNVPKGYTLRLPQSVAVAERMADALPSLPDSPPAARQKAQQSYQVKKGDTILSIAKRHEVSGQDLIAYNQLGRTAVIKVGQRLVIPAPEGKRSSQNSKTRVAQKNSAGK